MTAGGDDHGAWAVPPGRIVPCAGVAPGPDPFAVPVPSVIGLSGGRSSAYLLRRVLDAHGGVLPDGVHAAFANTGLLHPEAMALVRECSERWGVPVAVLQYDPGARGSTRVVDWDGASRDGGPFTALLSVRRGLPGPMSRFCTSELKVRRVAAYARDVLGHASWHYVSGTRSDEPGRVAARMRRFWSGKDGEGQGTPWMPLAMAGVDGRAVRSWWDAQGFPPSPPEADGRCDNCFLRSPVDVCGNMRRRPWTARWWVDSEAGAPLLGDGRPDRFRRGGPRYADLLARVRDQSDMFDPEVSRDD